MQCKFGKEKKLFTDERFRVKYGTIDAVKLNAIYLNIESWVQPREIENFDSYIRIMRREIIVRIKDNIDTTTFNENFIVDLDLRSSGIHVGKKSFLNLECYFYIKDTLTDFKSKELKENIKEICDYIIIFKT